MSNTDLSDRRQELEEAEKKARAKAAAAAKQRRRQELEEAKKKARAKAKAAAATQRPRPSVQLGANDPLAVAPQHALDLPPELQLKRKLSLPQVADFTSLSEDTIRRRYPHFICKL